MATAASTFLGARLSGLGFRCRRPARATAASRRGVPSRAVATAGDPLSSQERAEFDLLRHADAVRARRGTLRDPAVEVPPDEARVAQQKESFWRAQEDNYARWFNPKEYGNVLSEFAGAIDVAASPATCYALWNDVHAVRRFVPGMHAAARHPDGECVECEILYQFGSPRTNDIEALRFMTHRAEHEENAMVHWQSTDGFPNGIVVTFEPAGAGTTVNVEFYCHLPRALATKEGVMKVSLDVEERLAECLMGFADLAESVEAKGGPGEGEGEWDDEDAVAEAGTVPQGFGLRGSDGAEVSRDAPTRISRRELREAAEAFRARVGREPLRVELLKAIGKKR
jgi:uncharacterized membrane protein